MFELIERYQSIAGITSLCLGIVKCYFGYRVFKFILGLWGFIFGAVGVGTVSFAVTEGDQGVAVIAALIGGGLGAVLSIFFFFVGVFLVGSVLGVLVDGIISAYMAGSMESVVIIICAVIGGTIALSM